VSNRYPKARYVLPETIDPERICMSIMVPDDPQHLAAFRGAILTLASATSWANDPDHKAREVAAVWDEIYQEITNCMGLEDVRQNDELPCKLEKTTDGEEWIEFADLQKCPPKLRQSKGKLQWFDGSAWVDLPGGGDERYDGESTPQWPDPPPGQDGACLAAENIVASYITMLTQTKAALDLAATISGIVDIVAGYIGTQTLFPPALFILNISLAVGALVTLGSEAIEELIDSPNVDVLKCIISCNASADGAFTADEFDQIKDDIDDQIDDPEKLIMTEWINSYGPVGLTRIAAANDIEEGSCPCDCGWSYLWDFTVASGSGADPDYSWAPFFGYSNYVSSQGWTSIASDNYLTLPNAGSWTYCTFSINVTGSIGGTNHSDILNADYSVLLITVPLTSGVQTTFLAGLNDPPRTDGVGIETYNAAAGQTIITGCRIDGVGTPPPFYGGSFV